MDTQLVPNAVFYYDKEEWNRTIIGQRRRERLTVWLRTCCLRYPRQLRALTSVTKGLCDCARPGRRAAATASPSTVSITATADAPANRSTRAQPSAEAI